MALQDISPINDQLADIIVLTDEPWIKPEPGMAWHGPRYFEAAKSKAASAG